MVGWIAGALTVHRVLWAVESVVHEEPTVSVIPELKK